MSEAELLHSELTRGIIGAAMEVRKILGAGFLESVYEEALAIEFDLRRIPYERQKPIDVRYKGRPAKQFACDFVVSNKVLVALKAIKGISDIEQAQVLNYLKSSRLNLGLLLDFGCASLEIKRMINSNP